MTEITAPTKSIRVAIMVYHTKAKSTSASDSILYILRKSIAGRKTLNTSLFKTFATPASSMPILLRKYPIATIITIGAVALTANKKSVI